jgi:1-acyl-sn-glycerol-3-phosphate acyltransferase
MKFTLGFIRFLGIIVIIAAYLVPIVFGVIILKKDLHWTIRKRQNIARALVRWLNIRIQLQNVPPQYIWGFDYQTSDKIAKPISDTPQYKSNFLFVSNHRSYVDPVIVNCFVPTLPVAKLEVADWPLIGFGAKITGVLYVKRVDKQSRADTRAGVREALQKKFHVLIYPEGTTSDLPQCLPFRFGSFKTAIEENKGILPIAIDYGLKSDAWIGRDTFVPHFMRCFGKWSTDVKIAFGEPIYGDDAETLAEEARYWIDKQL